MEGLLEGDTEGDVGVFVGDVDGCVVVGGRVGDVLGDMEGDTVGDVGDWVGVVDGDIDHGWGLGMGICVGFVGFCCEIS